MDVENGENPAKGRQTDEQHQRWQRIKFWLRWCSMALAVIVILIAVANLAVPRHAHYLGGSIYSYTLCWVLPAAITPSIWDLVALILLRLRRLLGKPPVHPGWEVSIELLLCLAIVMLVAFDVATGFTLYHGTQRALWITENSIMSVIFAIRFTLFTRACREVDRSKDRKRLRAAIRALRERGIELPSLAASNDGLVEADEPGATEATAGNPRASNATPEGAAAAAAAAASATTTANVAPTGVLATRDRSRDPPPDDVDWTIEENFKFIMPYDIIRDDPGKCQIMGPDETAAKYQAPDEAAAKYWSSNAN